jgi:hypothetical protein
VHTCPGGKFVASQAPYADIIDDAGTDFIPTWKSSSGRALYIKLKKALIVDTQFPFLNLKQQSLLSQYGFQPHLRRTLTTHLSRVTGMAPIAS